MNSKQKKILIVGILLVALVGAFPPWYYMPLEITNPLTTDYRIPAGYHLITNTPEWRGRDDILIAYAFIDVSKWLIQCTTIVLIVGGALLLFKGQKTES